jgi:hypothetical protein
MKSVKSMTGEALVMNAPDSRRLVRAGAIGLAAASVLFVLYPAIRPFTDEKTLQGAAAFASNAWTVAHVLGMLAFIGLAIGLLALLFAPSGSRAGGPAFWAVLTGWIGAGLTLTYYGAEVYGLRVVGQHALADQDTSLLTMAEQIRLGPGAVLFGTGLVLLAVAGVAAAVAIWRSGTLPRWSGVLLAAGLVLYTPQYWGNQPVRIAHGVLLAAGCLWLAAGLWRARAHPRPPVSDYGEVMKIVSGVSAAGVREVSSADRPA